MTTCFGLSITLKMMSSNKVYCTYITYVLKIKESEVSFLGAFTKLRKAIVSFVIPVHPSDGTTELTLDGFS